MKKMFRLMKWPDGIEPVVVVRVTEKTVLIEEPPWCPGGPPRITREKKTSWRKFFDTWREAHAALVERCEGRLAASKADIVDSENSLHKARAMKEPRS